MSLENKMLNPVVRLQDIAEHRYTCGDRMIKPPTKPKQGKQGRRSPLGQIQAQRQGGSSFPHCSVVLKRLNLAQPHGKPRSAVKDCRVLLDRIENATSKARSASGRLSKENKVRDCRVILEKMSPNVTKRSLGGKAEVTDCYVLLEKLEGASKENQSQPSSVGTTPFQSTDELKVTELVMPSETGRDCGELRNDLDVAESGPGDVVMRGSTSDEPDAMEVEEVPRAASSMEESCVESETDITVEKAEEPSADVESNSVDPSDLLTLAKDDLVALTPSEVAKVEEDVRGGLMSCDSLPDLTDLDTSVTPIALTDINTNDFSDALKDVDTNDSPGVLPNPVSDTSDVNATATEAGGSDCC